MKNTARTMIFLHYHLIYILDMDGDGLDVIEYIVPKVNAGQTKLSET